MDLRERNEARLTRQELLLDLLHWAISYNFFVCDDQGRKSIHLLAVDAQVALLTEEPMSKESEGQFRDLIRCSVFPPVMGIEGAAAYLGLSVGSIRYHIRVGNLQPFRTERSHAWLFTLDDLDRFIREKEGEEEEEA